MTQDTPPLFLCATARLAQGLRQALQQQARAAGRSQWQAPTVLPLQDWLNQTISQALLSGAITLETAPMGMLSPPQEALLWEQAIEQCLQQQAQAALFNTSGLASAAMEANRYLVEWAITLDPQQATEESQAFLSWRTVFQRLCKQSGWLEPVRYQAWQIAQLKQLQINWPPSIYFAGFDRVHPHLKNLEQGLLAQGVKVDYHHIQVTPQRMGKLALPNADAEMRAAVQWAQQRLSEQPDAQLAIVVPELESQRAPLSALLDDVLHPETLDPAHAEDPRCYEFSLGLPLKQWPMVQSALRILRLAFHPHAQVQTEYSAWLADIYCAHAEREAEARAKLDRDMRQFCPLQLRLRNFVKFVARQQTAEPAIESPLWLAALQALMAKVDASPKRQTASQWGVTFMQCLSAMGWPGARPLSSHEYQCQQALLRALTQLSSLEPWLGAIDATHALHRFSQLCQAQIFQPQTVRPPNLTVMGMLEASASALDGVWVMGMNDHLWPPLARTNALIPAEDQRRAGTPNASSDIQYAFAEQVHARLTQSASEVIFSYALQDADRQLRPSPLIQALATLSVNELPPLASTLAERIARQASVDPSQPNSTHHAWQWIADAQAPAVADGEHVSGGTGLLRAQALCPAWAFYQYRLKARALASPHHGLDAMQCGELIHQLLAAFWSQSPQPDLTAVTEHQLHQALIHLASTVMQRFNEMNQQRLSTVFCTLEAERLAKLATTWLWAVERQRSPDFQVLWVEKRFQTTIEGIQITLVIDRADQLADGRWVVMDYKTGSAPDFKNWGSQCITEPQLPMYAAFLLEDQALAAVVFAKVRLTDSGFAGVAAEDDILPGVRAFNHEKNSVFDPALFPDWQAVRTHWRQQITATALALKAGEAGVVFESEQALAYCDVLPLLRLPERQLQFERAQSSNEGAL